MTAGSWALLVVAAIFAAGDWVAVVWRERRLEYVCKPMTMVFLLATAGAIDVDNTGVQQWFLVALGLCLLGDIFLMLPQDLFVPGLTAFLLGHVAYIAGMFTEGVSLLAFIVGLALVALGAVFIGGRIIEAIKSGEHAAMATPVAAYMAVISVMVASAIGLRESLAIGGALLFYTSDALIAWQRFVKPQPWHAVAIIVTYHLAQAGLTLSLAT
jgi:uncharacterized membrane protein YhhN